MGKRRDKGKKYEMCKQSKYSFSDPSPVASAKGDTEEPSERATDVSKVQASLATDVVDRDFEDREGRMERQHRRNLRQRKKREAKSRLL
jgi:hypothetical protein